MALFSKALAGSAALAIATLGTPAIAQTSRGGGSSASPQIMQQYQQLSAERTTLLADNTRLKKDAEDAKAQLAATKKELDALKARAGGSAAAVETATAAKASAEQALADTRRKLDELVGRYRETATTLQTIEAERTRLGQELAKTAQGFDRCATDNVALYDLNDEVLTRWEHEGLFTRIARSEPFTQLKRTELENLIDGYRARAAEAKVRQATPRPVAPASGEPPSNR